MKKHTILFLAANPTSTDPLALDREARAIHVELERSGSRDCFELVTRWAAEPLDLLRELRKLKPTIVHFSGHGGRDRGHRSDRAPRRDAVAGHSPDVAVADPPRRDVEVSSEPRPVRAPFCVSNDSGFLPPASSASASAS